jgi:hypothetical protein
MRATFQSVFNFQKLDLHRQRNLAEASTDQFSANGEG